MKNKFLSMFIAVAITGTILTAMPTYADSDTIIEEAVSPTPIYLKADLDALIAACKATYDNCNVFNDEMDAIYWNFGVFAAD